MRRLTLVAVTAAAVLTAAPSGAGAQALPDANCPGPALDGFGGPDRLAQTFTALQTGSLDRVEVEIQNAPQTTDHVFQINAAAGGVPTDSVLATATITDAAMDASIPPSSPNGRANVVFPAPASVTAGQGYALVLSRPGGAPVARTVPDATCPGRLFEDIDGPWTPVEIPPQDLVFATFVTPTVFCKGRQATVRGTAGADQLLGTQGSDVIAALDGDDEVSGLGGRDVICGGTGKDKLRGGKGKDRLLGQAGADTLRGGKGNDICKGGKGRDAEKSC